MASLLFVEDNEDLLANLYAWFEPRGHLLDCARDGAAAFKRIVAGNYDCIVLDVMLPRLDGFSLCRKLREENVVSVPIIMLTARDAVEDRVKGLELGADDYLVKPFSLRELEARINALMRRPPGAAICLRFDEIEIFPGERRALRNGVELRLAPASFSILLELVRSAPNLVSRQRLEDILWGEAPPGGSALRNHILELRRALDKPFGSSLLQTVPHQGYRLARS